MGTLPNLSHIKDPEIRLALENVYRLLQSNAEGDLSGVYPNLQIDVGAVGAAETDGHLVKTSGTGGETGLRIIRGRVNTAGSGTIDLGTGFTISRNGTGDVTVTFTTAFSAAPVVTLGSNRDECFHGAAPTTTTCRPNTADTAGAPIDGTFHFIAIGPS